VYETQIFKIKITYKMLIYNTPHSPNYQVTHLTILFKYQNYSCLSIESALVNHICKHILCITMYQLDKTIFNFSFALNDDESQYVLCKHERLGSSIKVYNFSSCHI